MYINLLPVYSKIASPPQELASRLPDGLTLSQHQVETYRWMVNAKADVIINTAITGDGKSLAAYLPTLTNHQRHAFGMYPTIELSRDQQKQFENYATFFQRKIRCEALWGAHLGRLSRERSAKRRGEILKERFNNYQVILTNPDIFNLVMNYSYGSNIFSDQELPYTLANNFDDLIFDEFHIFSTPQIVAVLTAMLFFLEYMPHGAPQFLFSSATPDPLFVRMMKRAGIHYEEICGEYSTLGGDDWRCILHPTRLALHMLENSENTEIWLQKNLHCIIQHWEKANQKPKGAIILNSVIAAKRVVRLLTEALRPYNITVGEVTGLTDDQQRRKTMEEADLVIGTSTIDVGIDFNISFLIFETLDAGTFLQRLGRLGRVRRDEKPFDFYEAHVLFSNYTPWVYERFLQCLQERNIKEGDTIDRPNTLREIILHEDVFPRATAFTAYARRWGILQAAHIIGVLESSRREQSFYSTAQELYRRYEALFDLKDFNYAAGRYRCLMYQKQSSQKQENHAILDEVLSFRGRSQTQATVWDDTSDSPVFIGYDALHLVQNTDYLVVDANTYQEVLQQLPPKQREDAEEELHWAMKGKGEQPLILKISQFLPERESLVLEWEGVHLREYTGRVVALRGCIVKTPRTSDLGKLNQFLRRQLLVCYFTRKEIGELRRNLWLPPHFLLYRVEQLGKPYTVAFGKTALLLESEMLRFRGRDEETEAIIC